MIALRCSRNILPLAVVGLASAVLLTTSGCKPKAPPKVAAPVDESPQAKFDRIVAFLRQKFDEQDPTSTDRFTLSDEAGSATTLISYEMQVPEKIEPAKPGELPRATIRVIQKTSYSALSSSEKDTADQSDSAEGDSPPRMRSNLRDPGDAEEETDALSGDLLDASNIEEELGSVPRPRIKAPDITSQTINTDSEVVYELIYENERWRMAVPPAADAPDYTNESLQLALKRQ